MHITFNVELDSRANKKGEKLLMVRCSQNKKHKRLNTGIHVIPKYWDTKRKMVKKSHPLAASLNVTLNQKIEEILQSYLALVRENKTVELSELINAVDKPRTVNFYEFAAKYKLKDFQLNKKLGTYRRYESVLNKLKEFAGSTLTIKQIDYTLLTEFETYLLEVKKNGRDTVSSNLSVIRSIVNEAIKHEVFEKRNPFDSLSLKYTNNTKTKLTVDELKKFSKVILPNIPSLHLAKDFFMACFYSGGCRAGDMLMMKWNNINANTITYTQQKTGKKLILPLLPELELIFKNYRGNSLFIFPFLQKEKEISEAVLNSKLTYINKYLKEVCKYAGIFKKITTHCARHTFADISLDLNDNDIYALKDVLGHSSVKTTELYLRDRNYSSSKSFLEAIKKIV